MIRLWNSDPRRAVLGPHARRGAGGPGRGAVRGQPQARRHDGRPGASAGSTGPAPARHRAPAPIRTGAHESRARRAHLTASMSGLPCPRRHGARQLELLIACLGSRRCVGNTREPASVSATRFGSRRTAPRGLTRRHVDARLSVLAWEVNERQRKYGWAHRHEEAGPEQDAGCADSSKSTGAYWSGARGAIRETEAAGAGMTGTSARFSHDEVGVPPAYACASESDQFSPRARVRCRRGNWIPLEQRGAELVLAGLLILLDEPDALESPQEPVHGSLRK